MRVIGYVEHPAFKISIFKNDGRISVKFENEQYEQTFKLGEDERFASVENVQKWVDQELIDKVSAGFRLMHEARLQATGRAFPSAMALPVFEEII